MNVLEMIYITKPIMGVQESLPRKYQQMGRTKSGQTTSMQKQEGRPSTSHHRQVSKANRAPTNDRRILVATFDVDMKKYHLDKGRLPLKISMVIEHIRLVKSQYEKVQFNEITSTLTLLNYKDLHQCYLSKEWLQFASEHGIHEGDTINLKLFKDRTDDFSLIM